VLLLVKAVLFSAMFVCSSTASPSSVNYMLPTTKCFQLIYLWCTIVLYIVCRHVRYDHVRDNDWFLLLNFLLLFLRTGCPCCQSSNQQCQSI